MRDDEDAEMEHRSARDLEAKPPFEAAHIPPSGCDDFSYFTDLILKICFNF